MGYPYGTLTVSVTSGSKVVTLASVLTLECCSNKSADFVINDGSFVPSAGNEDVIDLGSTTA